MQIPYAYQVMKHHKCKMCGADFQSGHPEAKYCTIKCQRRAATLRRKGRDATGVSIIDERYYAVIKDPTVAQLDSYAKDILLDMTHDKPIAFIGVVPRWTPPKGVQLIEQVTIDYSPPTFLMTKHEPSIMDILSQSPQ